MQEFVNSHKFKRSEYSIDLAVNHRFAQWPKYFDYNSLGFTLYTNEEMTFMPSQITTIRFGLSMQNRSGYYYQMAIDSMYRSLGLVLLNPIEIGNCPWEIKAVIFYSKPQITVEKNGQFKLTPPLNVQKRCGLIQVTPKPQLLPTSMICKHYVPRSRIEPVSTDVVAFDKNVDFERFNKYNFSQLMVCETIDGI